MAEPDGWLGRYGRLTPFAQAYADLFSMPGWQAARFIESSTQGRWPPVTNPFYSSEQTEQSRAVLDEVLAAVPEAILIGGWGTWVRTGGPMSHDIDLIVDRGQLAEIARHGRRALGVPPPRRHKVAGHLAVDPPRPVRALPVPPRRQPPASR